MECWTILEKWPMKFRNMLDSAKISFGGDSDLDSDNDYQHNIHSLEEQIVLINIKYNNRHHQIVRKFIMIITIITTTIIIII